MTNLHQRDFALLEGLQWMSQALQAPARLVACMTDLSKKYPELALILETVEWGLPGGWSDVSMFLSEQYLGYMAMREAALYEQDFGWYCTSLLALLRDPRKALDQVQWDAFPFKRKVQPLLQQDRTIRALTFILGIAQPCDAIRLRDLYAGGSSAEISEALETGEKVGLFTRTDGADAVTGEVRATYALGPATRA